MSFSPKKIIPMQVPRFKQNQLFYQDSGIQLWEGDARKMDFIKDNSVQLIVTSPPYNVHMNYGEWHDSLSIKDYLRFTEQWLSECYRVLCYGGRLAVNMPSALTQSTGSKIAFLAMNIWNIAIKKIKFLPRDWIIWRKMTPLTGVTSWGSWCSASSPFCRDIAEFIIVFNKKSARLNPQGKKSDLTPEEFLHLTKNLWVMTPERRQIHPAPFPLELPLRVIKLYSFPGDLVLDPFVGSGTSILATKLLHRQGIGIDYNKNFLEIAKQRISQKTLFKDNVLLTKLNFNLENDEEENITYNQIELWEM